MITLFDSRRAGLLAAVLAAALVQLAATLVVARMLHGGEQRDWMLAAVAAVIGFACEALLRRLSEGLGLQYVTAVRAALFRHLMRVDPAIVQRRRHGAMLQSFVGDLTALRQWVAEGIMRALLAVIALAGLLGWLAMTAPKVAIAAGVVVTLACLVGGALVPALSRAVGAVRRERGRVSAFASERLTASATVLACGRGESETRRLARRVDRFNRAALRRAWLTGVLRAVPHLAGTAIVIAAVLLASPQPSGGMAGLVLVIGIIALALRDLARAAELAVPGLVSYRRVARLLALAPLTVPQAQPWVRGEARRLVLDRLEIRPGLPTLSAAAGQGEVILLDGNPGHVTMVLRVLAGLARPHAGSARWNGMDLIACRPSRRRRYVGLASADLPLLQAGNALNLRYRAPGVPADALAALAAEWDIDLGGDQADPQRLAVLRAILGKPPLLLLAPDDRALAAEDAERLARTINDWPGVVLIVSRHPALVHAVTRRWTITAGGLADEPAGTLTLIPPATEHAA